MHSSPRENLWCFLSRSFTDPSRILQRFVVFSWGNDEILKKACSHGISRSWQDWNRIQLGYFQVYHYFWTKIRSGNLEEACSHGVSRSWQDFKQDIIKILNSLPLDFKTWIRSGNLKSWKKRVATRCSRFAQDLYKILEGSCQDFNDSQWKNSGYIFHDPNRFHLGYYYIS